MSAILGVTAGLAFAASFRDRDPLGDDARPGATASGSRRVDVIHNPPLIYQQGDRLTLEFELVCPPKPDQVVELTCGEVAVELTFSGGGEGSTVRTASTDKDRIEFTLPESVTAAGGLAYRAEFTLADGTTVKYPAEGGSMSAISISKATEVDLGAARFSPEEQDLGELVVSGGWGDGPDEFGINETLDGPPTFDIDPTTGDIVILDQMNSRIVRVSANGKSEIRPIQLRHGGMPDLAVAPDGTLDVLYGNAVSGAAVEQFAPSGGTATGEIPLATPSGVAIRRVGDDVWVEGDDSYWMRVSHGKVLATPAEQVASAASGLADGDHLVIRKHLRELGNEVRIADVGPSGVRAWRLTGETSLGPVVLAAPLPDGRVVVVQSQFDNDHSQYTLLTLGDGAVETRVVPQRLYAGLCDPSEFRLVGTSLYQIRSTTGGFSIYRYQL